MSNQRADASLNQGRVDIALNYSGHLIAGIYKSQSVISYENVVVSLKKVTSLLILFTTWQPKVF